jgi:hypothetical protein
MNKTVLDFTRQKIIEGLKQLPKDWVKLFNRMYNHKNLDSSIEDTVIAMPDEKLDWALTQVENSIKELGL